VRSLKKHFVPLQILKVYPCFRANRTYSGRERTAGTGWRSLGIRIRGVIVNHRRRRQLPMGGVEFDQLQEGPLDRRQCRLLRQEGIAHAAKQLLQLRGQLHV